MTRTQRYFGVASLFVGALLVRIGAPLPTVAAGLVLAGVINWKRGAFTAR